MTTWIVWLILIIAAYFLGSLPLSYLVAKARGIDLISDGTRQTGAGNLWRTTSRKVGLAIGIFDFLKGLIMVWIAQTQGMDVAQQIAVGLATIVGHNWPVFLRFHGGRGAATALGIVIIVPSINDISPWPAIIAVCIVVIGSVVIRSSPLPVIVGAASLPLTNWAFREELAVIMAYLAMVLILVIKRLTAQPAVKPLPTGMGKVLLNRLLFDRDIRDKKLWMSRKSIDPQKLLDDAE